MPVRSRRRASLNSCSSCASTAFKPALAKRSMRYEWPGGAVRWRANACGGVCAPCCAAMPKNGGVSMNSSMPTGGRAPTFAAHECRRRPARRRWQLARQGRRLHLRRTLRHSLRYGGTPLDPVYNRRRRRQPRLVLLMDVSRSMSLYSYFFLRFARGVLDVFRDAHAFVYHTHLVPVTEALRGRDIDKVKAKLAVISLGWGGGTRIGESLQTFNEQHGRRLLSSRTVVIVVSDGLDTGAPALLAEQLAHIKRRARKVVWLNPLLGRAGYEPLAGGMAAALPLIDVFASAHNLASLAALKPHKVRL